jgi:hypothetical protein
MAAPVRAVSNSTFPRQSSARGRQALPALTVEVPPAPLIVFPAEREPSAPPSPTRSRTIRFNSRVRIRSLRHSSHHRPRNADHATRSESAELTKSENLDEYDSDSSSISVALHESSSHQPVLSPLPKSAGQGEPESRTALFLGPSYGWSEHTPLLAKGSDSQNPLLQNHRRYSSDPALSSAALARAQAVAKRTEEDVRCAQIEQPYLSFRVSPVIADAPCISKALQWWCWKFRQDICCCFCSDDDDDDPYD